MNDLLNEHNKDKEKRGRRRIEKEKKKKKARKIYPYMGENADKLADNLCNCSCGKCKTGRKSPYSKGKCKKTIQERKFDDTTKDNWSE
jgi:hypothetical protein